MSSIVNDFANILPGVERRGDFYVTGTSAILAPNLAVDGVGQIALPLLPVQAEQLIAVAARAPYGRGEETLLDTGVRRTWQIGAEQVRLGGRDWPATLDAIVARAAAGLGVAGTVSAELYKLLIYDTGSFFVEHRDTEKAPRMFATLVIVLPCHFSGGELLIRHQEREVCFDPSRQEPSDVSFAAFYADCVHQVRPVTSGYRLTLVYNLLRDGAAEPPAPPADTEQQRRLVDLVRQWSAARCAPDGAGPEKLVYPLEHAYTTAELGFDALKNVDAAAAAGLLAAAAQTDCELHLALVSIEESGSAENNGGYYSSRRGRWRDDEPDDDDFEIGEIIERDARISDWRHPDGSRPPIGALPFEEDELCAAEPLDAAEPDEQYFHEATGNEGASFERTYRRAALVLWPRARRLAVINQGGLDVTLPYLADLARRWSEGGQDMASPLWRDAHTLSGHMLADWPEPSMYFRQSELEESMLSSLALLRDTVRIDAFLNDVSGAGRYGEHENAALVRAAALLPPPRSAALLETIVARNGATAPGACADLLARAAADAGFAALLAPAAQLLVNALCEATREPASTSWRAQALATPALVADLLSALHRTGAAALAERLLDHVLARPFWFGLDDILVPAQLALLERPGLPDWAPARRLNAACLGHLNARIAEPLAPPADFRRTSEIACRCADCAALSRFLDDPVREVWIFKAAQNARSHVEHSIRQNGCDLRFDTDARGRPYSLVATKNQASYERRVQQRGQDLAHAAQLA